MAIDHLLTDFGSFRSLDDLRSDDRLLHKFCIEGWVSQLSKNLHELRVAVFPALLLKDALPCGAWEHDRIET